MNPVREGILPSPMGGTSEGAVMKISHKSSRRLGSARRDRGWIEFLIVYSENFAHECRCINTTTLAHVG